MVQRKGCSRLGIQVDHVRSDKNVANLKLAYSQRQDDTSIGNDEMKKMKMLSSIKLSGSETFQSLPLRKSLSQSTKLLPLHIPTIAATPQKHNKPLVRRSPNYMKPTNSSDAKNDLVPVSLQCGSDGKNLPQKVSLKNSKSSSISNKKTAKSMSRSSSVNLVRTLTKTLSFKPSTTCLTKSTMAVLRADINAPDRATCSSILKDSKYLAYLVHNLEGSESKGAWIIKVCPYTYCSLNGKHHDPLPQFNHIMSTRRCLLKSKKMEAPQRLKVPGETRKDFDIEQIVFDGIPACDEADGRNPIIIPLIQKIGMDFVIEVCDKERGKAYKMGRSDTVKHLEDQEGIKFVVEGNDNTAEEENLTLCVPCDLTKFEINPKVEFKHYFDTSEIEADTKESFHQKPCAEDVEKNHSPRWFHEEICAGSYSHEVGYDEEYMETTELDYSDSQGDMEWDKEQVCLVNHKEFGHLTNTRDNDREIEKCVDNEASCTLMVLDEDTIDNNEGHKICGICKVEESREDSNTKLENNDKEIGQRNQIPSSDVPEESIIIVQDKKLLEEDQVTDTKFQTISCICGEKWNTNNNWQWPAKNKRPMQDVEEMRKINPRKPNFLSLAPDLEPERVELKHQIMDDRKIAEEWMLDFSLRQAVTKLAPAGKKKVALLVEAFETVMSTSQCKTHTRSNSSFSHARPIQACS